MNDIEKNKWITIKTVKELKSVLELVDEDTPIYVKSNKNSNFVDKGKKLIVGPVLDARGYYKLNLHPNVEKENSTLGVVFE